MNKMVSRLLHMLVSAALLVACVQVAADETRPPPEERITVSFRGASIEEVYEMLAIQGRVNILLGKGVSGNVSVNLYDVDLDMAIRAIADSAGYIVEERNSTYTVLDREESGKDAVSSNTRIRTFKVQYTDPEVVEELLEKHLSRYGKLTTLKERHLLVVEDLPEFLDRIEGLLSEIDVQPKQILIEAKILEIELNDDQKFGIDWSKITRTTERDVTLGTSGLVPGPPGFFLDYVTPDLTVFLTALASKDRVRTLSTPKLLVLENQEAEVLIGERQGYEVSTTIDGVTTQSIEFVESGVILRVSAAVDRSGRIMLDVHPEVSVGTLGGIKLNIPNIATTEVTTQFLAEDGEQLFIGGLIKNQDKEARSGVPVLSDIPILGNLFSATTTQVINTETVVMIRPHVVKQRSGPVSRRNAEKVERVERQFGLKVNSVLSRLPTKVDRILSHEAAADRGETGSDTGAWDGDTEWEGGWSF